MEYSFKCLPLLGLISIETAATFNFSSIAFNCKSLNKYYCFIINNIVNIYQRNANEFQCIHLSVECFLNCCRKYLRIIDSLLEIKRSSTFFHHSVPELEISGIVFNTAHTKDSAGFRNKNTMDGKECFQQVHWHLHSSVPVRMQIRTLTLIFPL